MSARASLTAAFGVVLCACGPPAEDFNETEWAVVQSLSPMLRGPAPDERLARFGQRLFFERALSGELQADTIEQPAPLGRPGDVGKVSCADCHHPDGWFSDIRSSPNNVSLGVRWTRRNSPSLVNVDFYATYAWDGFGPSLAEQCELGYRAAAAMAGTPELARAVLGSDEYGPEHQALFPSDVDPLLNLRTALAAYVRMLVSDHAPLDAFVAGDPEALPSAARRGLKLFIGKAGCVECHSGPNLARETFENLGVPQSGPRVPPVDLGRYEAVQRSHPGSETLADIGRFRVKGLRQVAMTAPYMHAGQLQTLAEVVAFYDAGGADSGFSGTRSPLMVPLRLTAQEQADLVTFLEHLTGQEVDPTWRCDPTQAGKAQPRPWTRCP